jgi:hypothetical protein
MEPPITPPTEYPRMFKIKIIKGEYLGNRPEVVRKYLRFWENYDFNNIPKNLDILVRNLRNDYENFNYKEEEGFLSMTEFNELLDDLYNAKDGDIIVIYFGYYYVYGNGTKLVSISMAYGPIFGHILPKEALNYLKCLNIHEKRDIEKYYPDMHFNYIQIPHKYFPPQLYEVDKNMLVFLINNKNGITEGPNKNFYKELPVISVNIGDEEDYIIYLSVPSESAYIRYFRKRPEEKM